MKKIGMLTSGGDCQGLNPTIRGVAKGLYTAFNSDVEIYGFQSGYKGLIEGQYKVMKPSDFSGILTLGGTILGTSRQPFKAMRVADENNVDKLQLMVDNYKKMKLDGLVVMGGNGTHKSANMLSEAGLNIIGLPKTIDNDIFGTDITFGFQSAVDIATDVIDRIHSTATSHGRIFIVELMGNKAGFLTLHAGMAGGADIILIPEIPYDPKVVADALKHREEKGKAFSIIVVAEGAISKEEAAMPKKAFKEYRASFPACCTAGFRLAQQLEELTPFEVRVTVPGHYQRGGSPCAFDRVLCTKLGAQAATYIKENRFGVMVGIKNQKLVPVPLKNVAGVNKRVELDDPLIMAGKAIEVSFGV